MADFDKGDIVVVGAGLVGSLLAYILQKRGFSVTVFERYGDIRQIPSLGRSINLVITNRGLRACDAIGGGLREELLAALAVAVTGRVIHQQDGTVQFQRYGKDDSECNYSIGRCLLLNVIYFKSIYLLEAHLL
jgi:kynurenine 3-monooxygenase